MRLQEGKLDFEIWIFFCQHPLVGVRLLSGGDDYRDDHDLHHDHDKNWPANWWASSPRSTQSFSTSAAGASTSTPSPQASTARFWNVKSQTLISGTKSSTADVSPKIQLFEKLGQHAVTEILKKMPFCPFLNQSLLLQGFQQRSSLQNISLIQLPPLYLFCKMINENLFAMLGEL